MMLAMQAPQPVPPPTTASTPANPRDAPRLQNSSMSAVEGTGGAASQPRVARQTSPQPQSPSDGPLEALADRLSALAFADDGPASATAGGSSAGGDTARDVAAATARAAAAAREAEADATAREAAAAARAAAKAEASGGTHGAKKAQEAGCGAGVEIPAVCWWTSSRCNAGNCLD